MLMFVFLLLLATHICRAQGDPHRPRIAHLRARQVTANTTTSSSTSTSQASSCPSQGWAPCGAACVDVANGATCCDTSTSHWCMPGNSCLLGGLCCLDGVGLGTCVSGSGVRPPVSLTGLPTTLPTGLPTGPISSPGSSSGSSTGTEIGFLPSTVVSDGATASSRTATVTTSSGPITASSRTATVTTSFGPITAPVTTTFGPITATVAGNPVTLAFSGELLPLQTVANHKPVSPKFKEAVFAALAKDPATKAFGDLLAQAPSAFEGLEDKRKYYLFVPPTQSVVDHIRGSGGNLPGPVPGPVPGPAHREVFVDPKMSQQFAEKPEGGSDIKHEPITLKTSLVGENKYSNLGEGEGARVIAIPTASKDGSVEIISGLGHLTLAHPDETPFEDGVIMKCDGFFTLPLPIEATFANTSGHLWSTAMEKANILKQVSEKRMVTIFAVQDPALDETDLPGSADLGRYIHDGLSYTPDMRDQLCLPTRDGGSVRITTKDNDRFVNGVRISKSNVIARNGVIHYLEGKIPPAEKCSDSGGQGTVGSGGQTVVSGGQTVVSGGQTIVTGGQTVVIGGQTVVSGGQTVVSGGQTMVTGGQTMVTGGQTVVIGGQTVVTGGQTVVTGGQTTDSGGQTADPGVPTVGSASPTVAVSMIAVLGLSAASLAVYLWV
ncbi:unnamed protein product [Tuber aestivum]|uniref:FAS1 domain-containing protein n=1 Tax=Tuber aestivum TaxID=59557 RepID=A0A292PV68_9PEZI|nr:unnamed protein product [Tuber aestivum]